METVDDFPKESREGFQKKSPDKFLNKSIEGLKQESR